MNQQSETEAESIAEKCLGKVTADGGETCAKPILVLINPHSGRGKSVAIYKKLLVPFLKSHQVEHHVFITQSESRVHDYLHNKSLQELTNYRSIVVVSGDGLLYETVNALMSRTDWEKAISIPIGLLPTGSGNGLAYTLIRLNSPDLIDQEAAIKMCCEQIIQEETSQADLVKITYNHHEEPTVIWSFLSLGWGLLADIDIDSEWLRRLGEYRFTLYGLLRSITSVSYKGRLSFKIAQDKTKNSTESDEIKLKIHDKALNSNSNSDMYITDSNRQHLAGSPHLNKTSASITDIIHDDDDWIHIEDKFVCLYAVYQAYVSSVTNFAPKSTLTDQLIYLTFIRGNLSPCKIIEFLLAIQDGSHENLSYVTVVPVKRFVFQPLEESKVVIDGEVVSWNLLSGPITAEVVPKVINFLWKPQANEDTSLLST